MKRSKKYEEAVEGVFGLFGALAERGALQPNEIVQFNADYATIATWYNAQISPSLDGQPLPWEHDDFRQAWQRWLSYKKEQHNFVYKSADSLQTALYGLFEKSKGDMPTAIKMINNSIEHGWQGLFAEKQTARQNSHKTTTAKGSVSSLMNAASGAMKILQEQNSL
ncbi:MAG: hypothetical protein ACRC9X_02950 [Bacteroidales bacterium]